MWREKRAGLGRRETLSACREFGERGLCQPQLVSHSSSSAAVYSSSMATESGRELVLSQRWALPTLSSYPFTWWGREEFH